MVTGAGAEGVGRRMNKLRRIRAIYDEMFPVIPFFTRDFSSLADQIVCKTFRPGQMIFNFDSVPTHFYVVRRGRIKFEAEQLYEEKQDQNSASTGLIKVEGEWFGFESFICGPYARMTQESLLKLATAGLSGVGNGFRATAIERVELVCGKLETLFGLLKMTDVARLH